MIFDLPQRVGREYNLRKWANCPIETPVIVNVTIPESSINKLEISGHIYVIHDIVGDVEMNLETNKCSLDMKKCDKYSTIIIRDLCKKFKENNSLYSNVFENIHPPFQCPIKRGNYTIAESAFDMMRIAMLPLDGYVWVIMFKMVYSENGQKPKKVAMCVNSETKMTKVRIASGN